MLVVSEKCMECNITLSEYEMQEFKNICIDCAKEKEKENASK
jgi:hypothetical protein